MQNIYTKIRAILIFNFVYLIRKLLNKLVYA